MLRLPNFSLLFLLWTIVVSFLHNSSMINYEYNQSFVLLT